MRLNIATALLAFFLVPGLLHAHDPGLSSADIRLSSKEVIALVVFSRSDLEPLPPAINGATLQVLEVTVDGHALEAKLEKVEAQDGLQLLLRYQLLPGSRLEVRSLLFERLPSGHRQLLTVRAAGKNVLMERMLSARENSAALPLANAIRESRLSTKLASAGSFALLGVEHILTGYDHLLFLFALLLAGGTFSAAARIITSFTLAHSLTLGLSTLDVVQISSSIVEPLIAASIICVGCDNLFRSRPDGRWLLTFAFGLVHGFGFSSVLREMGIGSQGPGALLPLFSFNLGVEIGQILIAAPALLLIWKLRQNPVFVRRGAPALSVLIALAGGFWLLERTLG